MEHSEGEEFEGVRHEDLTALTFADATFRHVISQEVLEHVPDYRAALKECARVLEPGGKLLFTVPFHRGERHGVLVRMRSNGTIEHLVEPPEYHGDPVDPNGCLCFYHFGWELIEDLKSAGFTTAAGYVFFSRDLCYSDSGQPADPFRCHEMISRCPGGNRVSLLMRAISYGTAGAWPGSIEAPRSDPADTKAMSCKCVARSDVVEREPKLTLSTDHGSRGALKLTVG